MIVELVAVRAGQVTAARHDQMCRDRSIRKLERPREHPRLSKARLQPANASGAWDFHNVRQFWAVSFDTLMGHLDSFQRLQRS
jgi:hypothetical protein